ncbi:MAG: RNA 2'-phosphotransferase [Verrucomicrobia bacterium]|nr:RNA 2'-phosphotransferase [Verrucomicrobiota bacterium]
MNEQSKKKISKRMSLVLRHRPDVAELAMDGAGWVNVEALIAAFRRSGLEVDRETIDEVVATNDKKRFEFDEAGQRIRARQGHSVEVELGYEAQVPPSVLLHGTAESNLGSIMARGIQKVKRHAVHLSTDSGTMFAVGARHGKAVLVEIDAAAMHAAGHQFYVTGNNVWLTDEVPPQFLIRTIAAEEAQRTTVEEVSA